MNKNDLRKHVKGQKLDEQQENDLNNAKSYISKIAPSLLKNTNSIIALIATVLCYFIYSIFAHTKEVVITFLVVGFIVLIPKVFNFFKSKLNKNKKQK